MKKRILDLQFRKVEWDIIVDRWENSLPTYFVLKSVYYFGVCTVGQLYGVDGCPNTPFQTLEAAEEYLKIKL